MDFSKVNVRALLAEFVGTFGLAGAVLASLNGTIAVPTALVAGITLSLFVLSVGQVSGSHLNPAVTAGMWSVRKIDTPTAVGYLVAQFAGALLAGVVMQTLLDEAYVNLGVDWFNDFDWTVMAAEAIGMGVFAFGVAGAVHNRLEGMSSAWLVGLSLTVGILFAATVSNGVINPAVAAGIESLDWSHLVGPVVGSVVGFNVYAALITDKGRL